MNQKRKTSTGKNGKKIHFPLIKKDSKSVSNDPVKRYLSEIRKYQILSKEEEFALARSYTDDGEFDAAVELVSSNLRLVVKIALEYQSTWINLLDLIQEGNVGLMQAVKKFDPTRNIRLSSYAQWWIRAYILKYLMDNYKLVKIGTTQAQRKLFYNLKKEKERLERKGFQVTTTMLAKQLNVREQDITEMEMRLGGREVSLNAPITEGEKGTLMELVPIEQPSADELLAQRQMGQELHKKLHEFSETLKGRDVEIWNRRLIAEEPMTLQEIGDLFGVSRERARQLESRILKKLKRFLRNVPNIRELTFPLFR